MTAFSHVPGVTFVASTGDYGAADPEYPAFSPNVVAVGGTSLTLNADNSYNSETGWGYYSDSVGAFIGSGGGISLYEPEPAYQQGVQSTGSRTTPDVSLVADPATGAWIADPYNLDPSNPFEIVGGTSLSAPAWAGLLALVNQGRAAAGESTLNSSSPTDTQQALYMLPQSDYNVIASGNNGYTRERRLQPGDRPRDSRGQSAGARPDRLPGARHELLGPDRRGRCRMPDLVNTGTSDGGPIDVFSVFDSLTVSGNGLGDARGQVSTTDLSNATTGDGRRRSDAGQSTDRGRAHLRAGIEFWPSRHDAVAAGRGRSHSDLNRPHVAATRLVAAQAIVEGSTISEHFVAVQRASAGNDITPFPTRLRGNRVPDSVLNELASDAVILRSHQGAQTFEATAFPSIAAKDEREGVGLESPTYVGSRAVQPSDTSNARLAMILLAAGFSGYRCEQIDPWEST